MDKKVEDAHWHHSAGKQFYNAYYVLIEHFDPLSASWAKPIGNPAYFCAGLALEHFLKGWLAFNNIKFPKSHNLNDLVSLGGAGLEICFEFNAESKKTINLLNTRYYKHDQYGMYDVRYPNKTGLRHSPHPDGLDDLLRKCEFQLRGLLRSNV